MSDFTQYILDPCPFCGGEPEIEREGTARQSCIIACTDCGCRLESGERGYGSDWNTRAPIVPDEFWEWLDGWLWKLDMAMGPECKKDWLDHLRAKEAPNEA